MDMIDRYKKWSLTHTNESDSDSDASGSNNGNDDNGGNDDSDWNLTVKGRPNSTYFEKTINLRYINVNKTFLRIL